MQALMNAPDPSTRFPRNGKLVGRLLVLAAALLWSTSGLFAKLPVFDEWSDPVRGPLLAFWRALFAALVLLPVVRRPRWKGNLVPLCGSFVVMNITYLSAMALTTAANTTWLQATAPWWVFVMLVFFFREPVVRRNLVPLGFGFLGVGLIVLCEIQGRSPIGVACGLASGVSYAGVVVFLRQLRGENPAWLIALCHLAAAIVMLPWVIYLGVWPSSGQLLVLAAFGVVQMGIPYVLFFRGLRTIGSLEAVLIGLVEPVVLPFWAYLARGEIPAWWSIVGAALILVGLLLRYVVLAELQRRAVG